LRAGRATVKNSTGSSKARNRRRGIFNFPRQQELLRWPRASDNEQNKFKPSRNFSRESFVAEKSNKQNRPRRKDANSAKLMNNPNPFVPQGSLLEQEKRRSRMKLAVFCALAVGVCGLTAMLIQGCKREAENPDTTQINDQTNNLASGDTNTLPTEATNTAAIIPPIPTNQVVVPPPPAPEPATSEYIVAKGDTLGKIAKKNGVTVKALEDANPRVVPTKLKVNQKLVIPVAAGGAPALATTDMTTATGTSEETYTVKSGDTLTKIAKRYDGLTVKAIESENNLSTTKIKVGQKLKIPAKAEAEAPTPAPVTPVVSPATAATAPSPTPAH
jgi:LysM repeat protein